MKETTKSKILGFLNFRSYYFFSYFKFWNKIKTSKYKIKSVRLYKILLDYVDIKIQRWRLKWQTESTNYLFTAI